MVLCHFSIHQGRTSIKSTLNCTLNWNASAQKSEKHQSSLAVTYQMPSPSELTIRQYSISSQSCRLSKFNPFYGPRFDCSDSVPKSGKWATLESSRLWWTNAVSSAPELSSQTSCTPPTSLERKDRADIPHSILVEDFMVIVHSLTGTPTRS